MNIDRLETKLDAIYQALGRAQDAVTEARAREEEGKPLRQAEARAAKKALAEAERELAAALKLAS
jgi:hypothetical protein